MHWRFDRLFLAPHRLAFACGALLFMLSGVWWGFLTLGSSFGYGLPSHLPPGLVHSLLMGFGFMPFFFIGLLFTAGPKWLSRPAVDARTLLPCLLPQVAGWLVFLLSVHARDPAFAQVVGAIGLAAVALGWTVAVLRFAVMVATSRVDDRLHVTLIVVGGAVGSFALALAAAGVALGDVPLVRAAVQLGLWGFVGLIFAAAAHRMVPFFSAAAVPSLDAWRPKGLLWVFVAVFALRAAVSTGEVLGVTQAIWALPLAAVELAAGLGCIALAVRWGLVQSLRIRLLAMLHIGFTWLGVALVLFGIAHALEAAGGPASALGLAPMHAYTMGFLASTMLAMVTRVSCGHGGRVLAADGFIWRLFWLLQVAILARLLGAVLMQVDGLWALALILAAALGWAIVCSAWGVRYGHWFGTPRPDGRAG
ncbi:MAG: NnrS family protein [Rhizobacter sp.]|nr:NnrS family protein [Rhizobacter sp.]